MGGLRGTAHSQLPSVGIARLHRYYLPIRLPAAHLFSSFRCPTYRCAARCNGSSRFSPVDVMPLYSMADLRPRGALHILAIASMQMLLSVQAKPLAHQLIISGLKCLMTLLSNFLRLTLYVTVASPRLLSVVWLHLAEWGFHPLNITPLAGRTARICPLALFFQKLFAQAGI